MIRSFLAILFLRLISLLPMSVTHTSGRLLGRLFYIWNNDLKKVSRKNVQLCFPELDEKQKDELVREALKQTAMAMLESGAIWLRSPAYVLSLVKEVTGREILDSAMASQSGVILVMPHLGSWEITALYSSSLYDMTSLYRPPRMLAMSDLVRSGRERMGATLVPTDARGVRALRKALLDGELVGILPDQDPGRGAGVFAPFFGIQANTMTLLSRLANKSGAVVLVAYAERLAGGKGYHLHYVSTPDCLADDDPVKAATCLNRVIENHVRELPGQYQWGYRRFRIRPDGEPRLYRRLP